jgi:hypothetical protein
MDFQQPPDVHKLRRRAPKIHVQPLPPFGACAVLVLFVAPSFT